MAPATVTIQCISLFTTAILLSHLAITSLVLNRPDDANAHRYSSRTLQIPTCALGNSPARTFLIVFAGHSGSTAISTELMGHSEIYFPTFEPVDHQEVFNTTLALKKTRSMFEKGLAQGKIPGFKIRPRHIENAPEEWAALAREFDTRIVWQYRKNLMKSSVAKYLSLYGDYAYKAGGMRSNVSREELCGEAGCRYRIDKFEDLHLLLKRAMRSQKHITSAARIIDGDRGCVFQLPYEEYLYNREGAMGQLQKFLGLREENTVPERFKSTGDSLCEVVENWDEMCTMFYGCHVWQHMLDDEHNGCFCSSFTAGPIKFCDVYPND